MPRRHLHRIILKNRFSGEPDEWPQTMGQSISAPEKHITVLERNAQNYSLNRWQPRCDAQLGIGIEQTNAGIGIPASRILVRYPTQKMPDCVGLVQYRTCSGIVSFFHSGTGLTGCRTVRHLYIYTYTYICICSMDLFMQHRSRQWTCINGGLPIKSSVRHRQFSVSLQRLVRHRHSGIMVSPVPLVTDQSVSAQLWYDVQPAR